MNRSSYGSPIVGAPSTFEIHTPANDEQGARVYLLAQVVQLLGAEHPADVYVDVARYLETGLRSWNTVPTPEPAATPAGRSDDPLDRTVRDHLRVVGRGCSVEYGAWKLTDLRGDAPSEARHLL